MKTTTKVVANRPVMFRGVPYKSLGALFVANPPDGWVICGNCDCRRTLHLDSLVDKCAGCGAEEYYILDIQEMAREQGLLQEAMK